jgi:hypothetical protein
MVVAMADILPLYRLRRVLIQSEPAVPASKRLVKSLVF